MLKKNSNPQPTITINLNSKDAADLLGGIDQLLIRAWGSTTYEDATPSEDERTKMTMLHLFRQDIQKELFKKL